MNIIKLLNKFLRLGGEGRWSVEENSLIPDEDTPGALGIVRSYHRNIDPITSLKQANTTPVIENSSAKSFSNNYSNLQVHRNILNGVHDQGVVCKNTMDDTCHYSNSYESSKHERQQNSLSNGTSDHSVESSYTLNVAVDEDKLPSVDFKSKINNNMCTDKPTPNKDGMDEYFKQCNGSNYCGVGDGAPKQLTTITTATVTGGTTREVRKLTTITTASVTRGTTREVRKLTTITPAVTEGTTREVRKLTTITTATLTGGTTREVRKLPLY